MSEDGYTLVEVLAALVMIGLAVGGLTSAMHVIGLYQGHVDRGLYQTMSFQATGQALDRLFAGAGPFTDDGALTGDDQSLRFDCNAATQCSARLLVITHRPTLEIENRGLRRDIRLVGDHVRFLYVGDHGASAQWPPSDRRSNQLRAVSLQQGSDEAATSLASVRLWTEHTQDCVFDPISRQCRVNAP